MNIFMPPSAAKRLFICSLGRAQAAHSPQRKTVITQVLLQGRACEPVPSDLQKLLMGQWGVRDGGPGKLKLSSEVPVASWREAIALVLQGLTAAAGDGSLDTFYHLKKKRYFFLSVIILDYLGASCS